MVIKVSTMGHMVWLGAMELFPPSSLSENVYNLPMTGD